MWRIDENVFYPLLWTHLLFLFINSHCGGVFLSGLLENRGVLVHIECAAWMWWKRSWSRLCSSSIHGSIQREHAEKHGTFKLAVSLRWFLCGGIYSLFCSIPQYPPHILVNLFSSFENSKMQRTTIPARNNGTVVLHKAASCLLCWSQCARSHPAQAAHVGLWRTVDETHVMASHAVLKTWTPWRTLCPSRWC